MTVFPLEITRFPEWATVDSHRERKFTVDELFDDTTRSLS